MSGKKKARIDQRAGGPEEQVIAIEEELLVEEREPPVDEETMKVTENIILSMDAEGALSTEQKMADFYPPEETPKTEILVPYKEEQKPEDKEELPDLKEFMETRGGKYDRK